jgi:putative holliday junction resolvase
VKAIVATGRKTGLSFDNVLSDADTGAMPVLDLADLPAALPLRAPLAGLDLGTRTIGVAVSDTSLTIASPLALIRREKFTRDAAALFELMAGRGAAGLVIGLPVNMDGSEGPRCQSVRAFARHLMRLEDVPVAFWDERLSSAAVNRVLIAEADTSRARRAGAVDKMAAAWILQGALDRLASL